MEETRTRRGKWIACLRPAACLAERLRCPISQFLVILIVIVLKKVLHQDDMSNHLSYYRFGAKVLGIDFIFCILIDYNKHLKNTKDDF